MSAWALIGIGALAVTLLVLRVGALGGRGKPTPTVVVGRATAKPIVTVTPLTATPLPKDPDTPTPSDTSTPSNTATPTDTPTPINTPALSGGTTRTRAVDGAVMVYVPAGEFTMGSADSDSQADGSEKPQHTVNVAAYWIDRTEVTNAQYRKFVDAGGYNQKQYWTDAGWAWRQQNNVTQPDCWGDSDFNQAQQPVVCVSWYEAYAYASWAGGRLPTEAEWEKAARGTDGRLYPWGNTWDGTRLNFCDKNCRYKSKDAGVNDEYAVTAPAESYANGVSPYGVHDLAGNVWEWVSSQYGSYPYRSDDGREDQNSTDVRILRGGSWNNQAMYVRSACRDGHVPATALFTMVFGWRPRPLKLWGLWISESY
ncbi:MAG: formylglycine-generating enzyme family protein [Anaerolineae bacterium]|nr:formylglycine-generating enzyme family protein [Anaerolineae bacterium]